MRHNYCVPTTVEVNEFQRKGAATPNMKKI